MHCSARACLAWLVGLSVTPWSALATQERAAPPDTFQLGLAAHGENRLEDALPLFGVAVRQRPADDLRWAYLADVMRRLGDYEEAAIAARRALRVNSCNTFAHEVLAGAHNPQYSPWPGAHLDSVWVHLQEALACDSSDGNIWMGIWIEAMRRGEDSLSVRALRELMSNEFFARPWFTYARWVLESAPTGAMLLTAGDIDTYPTAAVQAALGIRPDVVVINMPMVSLGWYTGQLVRRHGLPLPRRDFADDEYLEGDSLITFWRERAAAGTLDRPLLLAFSVGSETAAGGPGTAILSGPVYRIGAPGSPARDTAAIEEALRRAESLDWRGPTISDRDRSPVRRAGAMPAAVMVLYVAAVHGEREVEAGSRQSGRRLLTWAERLASRTEVSRHPYTHSVLSPLREALAGHPREEH